MAASSGNRCLVILKELCQFAVTFLAVGICIEYTKASSEDFTDYLLCRFCGHSVARASQTAVLPSVLAIRERNDSLSGVQNVFIQRFTNPNGQQFELITTLKAEIKDLEERSSVMTWFEGFTWQIAVCPHCRVQLGWTFRAESGSILENFPKMFYGLILDNLIEQEAAESIIKEQKFRAYGS